MGLIYTYNRSKRKKSKKKNVEVYAKYKPKKFTPLPIMETPYRRETPHYPSVETNSPIVCARPERQQYTGTLVKGIATMHKSNAVPIIDEQQAKDISRMRR